MSFLSNFKVGQRLALVIGGLLVVMALVEGFGLWGLNTLYAMTNRALVQDEATAHQAAAIEALVLQERRSEKDAFINIAAEPTREEYIRTWQAKGHDLTDKLAEVSKLELSSEDRDSVEEVRRQFKSYVEGFEATVARIHAGAITTTQDANTEFTKYKGAVHGMESSVEALNLRAQKRASGVDASIAKVRTDVQGMELALGAFGLGLAALVGWLVTRSIVQPLRDAVGLAESVATGDLTHEPLTAGRDELAQLTRALGNMVGKLRAVVTEVRSGVESVTTASAEIANGSIDLSQRTEEQAANLEQTAASMEELTSTVKQSAENARVASQLSAGATEAAERGGRVVGEVVATMQAITQSSNRISDIIGVIDGIAFQTNILALNAAVEAARAGEQGRGFAVVASEVRTLAHRSAQAAKEIKSLIERSVEKVDNGARQVTEAGQTMSDIVEQVKRVNGLVAEISGASVEQSQGIEQVGQAVSQLDQVTQQNAALVEESAAAADSMKHQAIKLAQTVSIFNIGVEAKASPIAAATSAMPVRKLASIAARGSAMQSARSTKPIQPAAGTAVPEASVADSWTTF